MRTRLQLANRTRDLALFNLAVDSKLLGCDVVHLRVSDIHMGDAVRPRATVCQRNTRGPVPFEITEPTREVLTAWLTARRLKAGDWMLPGRGRLGKHLTTRHSGRLVDRWFAAIVLDPSAFGTHSLRLTKVALIYKRTGNIRACQLLLGHTKLESTVRYLGIEVDDALILSEQTEI